MKKNKGKNNNNKMVVELGVKLDKKSFKIAERKLKRLLSMAEKVDKLTTVENRKDVKVSNNDYEVLTKGEYINWIIRSFNLSAREAEECWSEASSGYKFLILYKESTYSVDYFNKEILGGSDIEKTVG